jgi:ATP-dependent DNA ligase
MIIKIPKRPPTNYVTFVSHTTRGQVKIWACWIEGDGITVSSTWGIKGGKMQFTSDTMSPRGRKGTAAFKSAQQVAQEEHKRQVEKKLKAGYVKTEEEISKIVLDDVKVDLDFDHLPKSFAPAKPIREIDEQQAIEWDKQGLLLKQRKRDGMRHYLVRGKSGLKIYSRGIDDMTEHFFDLVPDLDDIKEGTIIDAEFIVERGGECRDDFIAVSQICRSLPDRARKTIRSLENEGASCRFKAFDLLFYNGLPIWQLPYRERYNALFEILNDEASYRVSPVDNLKDPLDQLRKKVRKEKWEGLVLWRKDLSTVVHMNRSPKRTNCYKDKPLQEDDFIATRYEFGKGRNSKVVGKICISGRYDGRIIPLGKVGTGLTDKTREEALKWKYPCVIAVKYEKMSSTGLRHPVFLKKHEDKKVSEI